MVTLDGPSHVEQAHDGAPQVAHSGSSTAKAFWYVLQSPERTLDSQMWDGVTVTIER